MDQLIYIEKILDKYKMAKCTIVKTSVKEYLALKPGWSKEKQFD